MANIRIDLTGALTDGRSVVFAAPCDCTQIEGLMVYYIKNGERVGEKFTMKDTHGNDLTGVGNLFMAGSYIHAILDTNKKWAYLQNADTNAYLEEKITPVDNLESTSVDKSLSAKQGAVLRGLVRGVFATTSTAETYTISVGGQTITPTVPTAEGYNFICSNILTNTTADISVNSFGSTGVCRVFNREDEAKEVRLTFGWIKYKSI